MTESNGGVVIVTGGAKGIGLSYVKGLVAEGYSVVVADLSDPSEVAEELEGAGGQALAVQVDITDPAATEEMGRRTVERFGRIDALVNNAGYFTAIVKMDFDEIPIEDWDVAYRTNVIGTWLCIKAVVPTMKEQGGGKIVNTASMTVPSGVPGFLHYVASKSAVVGMSRALARELGQWNITVNTISPDYIPHDPDYSSRQPEMAGFISNQRCLKRDQSTEDMVGTLLYLVGPGSDFVTGQDLWVNGGRLFH
ncbi:MAG: SDR family oxidoreductase [Actinobacteria bacterium]|nr:SDR family oxidoreductase [Actinomycetota bacterium]